MEDSDEEEVDIFKLKNKAEKNKNGLKRGGKRVFMISLSVIAIIILLFITIAVILLVESPIDYSGHKIYKLSPVSVQDLNAIIRIEKNFQIEFWNEPYFKDPSEPVFIQISSPQEEILIREELTQMKINFTISIEDLQKAIEVERIEHKKSENETDFDFSRYHTYEEILCYLKTEMTKSDFIEIDSIGKSFEGRKIPVIRVTNDKRNESKPIILIDSLIHSKEWVTGATTLYILKELISNKSMKHLIEKFEFYIMPIFNPDGYAYSWRTDRLWRKTRSFSILSLLCRGADPNRNFDINYCVNEDNSSPCNDKYCGDYPFSEPEVTAFRDFTLKLNQTNRLKAYFSLHSFKQTILFANTYKEESQEIITELRNLSNLATNAINSYSGSTYKIGSVSELMNSNSGSSFDWINNKLKVKLSFVFQLRDLGKYGYLLPKEMILPTAQELMVAINAILNSI